MSLTMQPMTLSVQSDYLNVARKLLEDVPINGVRLLNPRPGDLELAIDADNLLIEAIACECLREVWFYDWMVLNTRIEFVPGSLRQS